jgi:antitoxin (DNA-binding transcriptional repressor) of toxin-antitoxin stability system
MHIYNIHEAKTQLSRRVDLAAKGEPIVKVIALDAPTDIQRKRFGFMAGQIPTPDDFNTMNAAEIERLIQFQMHLPSYSNRIQMKFAGNQSLDLAKVLP